MVAVTYDVARGSAPKTAKLAPRAAARKAWTARLMDAIIAGRMEKARREVARYAHLSNHILDARDDRLVKTGAREMPFGG